MVSVLCCSSSCLCSVISGIGSIGLEVIRIEISYIPETSEDFCVVVCVLHAQIDQLTMKAPLQLFSFLEARYFVMGISAYVGCPFSAFFRTGRHVFLVGCQVVLVHRGVSLGVAGCSSRSPLKESNALR